MAVNPVNQHGGRRPGAGRKKGIKDRRTLQLEAAIERAAARLAAAAAKAPQAPPADQAQPDSAPNAPAPADPPPVQFEGDAHQFLKAVYQSPEFSDTGIEQGQSDRAPPPAHARIWVERLKNSLSVEHPIAGDELRAIKRYLATREDKLPWLFISERGQPLTRQAVNYLIRQAAESAGLEGVHPHTLRHSCGYYLADKWTDLRTIQDYLGHRDPRHTVHYTRVSGRRFEGLWK